MKGIVLFCLVVLAACAEGLSRTEYQPVFPVLPLDREEILGPPHWRLEWIDIKGNWMSWNGKDSPPGLSLTGEWTSPVLAWPYWPERGLYPGQMNPAGALYPWDAFGGDLVLNWSAGIDAFFWRELAAQSRGPERLPWYFDWPGFRELMKSEKVPLEIQRDPWLADWKEIAAKTVETGFDRRRIRAAAGTEFAVFPCPGGFWTGYSVFAEPVEVIAGEAFVLSLRRGQETWVSRAGMLRCGKNAWMFTPW